MKKAFLLFILLCTPVLGITLSPSLSHGANVSFERYIPTPQLVNEARLTHLFWDVYDIALYAPKGRYAAQGPFALEITYLLSLKGADIAKVAKNEMARLGMRDADILKKWHDQMVDIFPDVEKGEQLVGVKGSDGYTYFYNNGEFIGSVQDPEFSQYFFDIWLSPNTSRPRLRRELLGVDA